MKKENKIVLWLTHDKNAIRHLRSRISIGKWNVTQFYFDFFFSNYKTAVGEHKRIPTNSKSTLCCCYHFLLFDVSIKNSRAFGLEGEWKSIHKWWFHKSVYQFDIFPSREFQYQISNTNFISSHFEISICRNSNSKLKIQLKNSLFNFDDSPDTFQMFFSFSIDIDLISLIIKFDTFRCLWKILWGLRCDFYHSFM